MFGDSFICANAFQLQVFVRIQKYFIEINFLLYEKQLQEIIIFWFSEKSSSEPVDVVTCVCVCVCIYI